MNAIFSAMSISFTHSRMPCGAWGCRYPKGGGRRFVRKVLMQCSTQVLVGAGRRVLATGCRQRYRQRLGGRSTLRSAAFPPRFTLAGLAQIFKFADNARAPLPVGLNYYPNYPG